jgi:hypothetical protein
MFVGSVPHHVGHRHWVGRVEANRRADGWRHLYLVALRRSSIRCCSILINTVENDGKNGDGIRFKA